MTTRRTILKSALLAAGATMMQKPANAATPDYGIMGRFAPELQVDQWIDKDGKPTNFDLARHEGKWIFLKCWQSWCPGCHSHGFPALKKISDAVADNPSIVFAGIQTVFEGHYTNTADKLRKIQLQYDLQMPMGHDSGPDERRSQTMIDYRTGGTPWMILIDPERRVVFNDYGIDVDKAIVFLQEKITV